ncbi:hexokinase A [Quaeritorhiza haematococci]|nr:hexokinase A [Quaeritorhiza haematococci]
MSFDGQAALFFFGVASGIAICAVVQYLVNTYVLVNKKKESVYTPEPTTTTTKVVAASTNETTVVQIPSEPAPAPVSPITSHPTLTYPGHCPESYALSPSMPRLEKEFTVTSAKLQKIVKHMVMEMRKGLTADGMTLKMIPSYVVRRPKGTETGSFLALDLGGTNFRVCEVTLEGQGRFRMRHKKYTVSEELKTGSGSKLFDFFADAVVKFLEELGDVNSAEPRQLGFTFSFPVNQTGIDQGKLIHWSKGFLAEGVEGQDVVKLLQDAFTRKGVKINVAALVNDTVGTLMAHAYTDPQTYVGVILGTGTNAAYVESVENIPKWNGGPTSTGEMIINTEWGAFDNEQVVLPVTQYDRQLDRASANVGDHIFEKMISGMYLGEVVRYTLIDLISIGELFKGKSSPELSKPYGFETAYMSRIERDHSLELSDTKAVLEDLLRIPGTTMKDRRIVKRVCELIGLRAARLSAAGIAAIVTKINKLDGCTIAIDGSLFEHYPHFGSHIRDALQELVGISAENIVLDQARDGSGQGAALIAATAGAV